MSNDLIKPSWVVSEGLTLLSNMMVAKELVHTDLSDEFVAGRGEEITIRRPNAYTARTDFVMSEQDTDEGSVKVQMNKVAGVDIAFTDKERTLDITQFNERVLEPAMLTIANVIDRDINAEALLFPSWVGTPGQLIDAYGDFTPGPQRLDEMAVPNPRSALLSPADRWALVGNFSGLPIYGSDTAKNALQKAALPDLGGVSAYSSQNVPNLTVGTRAGSMVTNGASQAVTWNAVKNTYQQTLICDGFTASTTVKKGEVFTAGNVSTFVGLQAVNPVPGKTGESKQLLPYLREFVVMEDATADGSGNITLTISPPIITSGAQQTVALTSANTDGLTLTFKGTAGTTYTQNSVFHKNAIAFVSKPLAMPEGITGAVRKSYKGISMRFAPVWDGINSKQGWRFDILYGTKMLDNRLGTRISGKS